jgi:hypothetical protein
MFPPELFADLTRQGGGHAWVPTEVIATVMVLQALEGLSDREAIGALRRDIAWKVACGAAAGRRGVPSHGAGVLAQSVAVLGPAAADLRGGQPGRGGNRGAQGSGSAGADSTILEDEVTTQDTVTQLAAAIRRVRRLVPKARQVGVVAHDYELPGKPVCASDDPQAKQALCRGWSTTHWLC